MAKTKAAESYLTISESGRYAQQTISISGPMDVVLKIHADWLTRTQSPHEENAKPSGS